MTGALIAASFSSSNLNSLATGSAVLYQRSTVSPINATAATAINIGQLISNQTQLDAVGKVTANNQSDFYTFNFQGNTPLKLAFSNLTGTTGLRFQLTDSTGKVVADSQGTAAQQTAYVQLTTSGGLKAASGQYTVRVNYAPISIKGLDQSYSLSLYSGTQFSQAYQTTSAPQKSLSVAATVDNTLTFATNDAQLFSRQAFNSIGEDAASAVNIGWLSQDKTRLDVQSQLTTADQSDSYQFTLQQGNNVKLAFNNTTNTSGTRVKLLDASGLHVLADSGGTTAQRAAYASLTSSTGLSAKPAQYVVQVSYAPGADKAKTQNYNFQVYSGTTYSTSYQTIASAQTFGNAILTGNPNVAGFSSNTAAASYLESFSQGDAPDILSTLSTLT